MKQNIQLIIIVGILIASLTTCRTIPNVNVDTSTETPLTLSEKALDHFNTKEYYEAIGYYQAIIDNFDRANYEKEIAWAYYEIGFCYYYLERYDKANEYFDIVLNEFSIQSARTLAKKLKQKIAEERDEDTILGE